MENLGELVQTKDGSLTLRHPHYDEEFHAVQGARFEANALYIEGSGFRQQLENPSNQDETLTVLDLGLGLGYNAIMTIEAWWKSPGHSHLRLISLENTPELVENLQRPEASWKSDWSSEWRLYSEALVASSKSSYAAQFSHPLSQKTLSWEVLVGDACSADLRDAHLDFIWQDAFSPKKNPELWTPEWFSKLKEASSPNCRLVTYSVARLVKDNLVAAGWHYTKFKTPGNKKEWLKAQVSTT